MYYTFRNYGRVFLDNDGRVDRNAQAQQEMATTTLVYLIVAGALLGPIEPQPDSEAWAKCVMERLQRQDASVLVCNDVAKRETPAETCAHAMKEIGFDIPVYRNFEDREPQYWMRGRLTAYCITAPTGLKPR